MKIKIKAAVAALAAPLLLWAGVSGAQQPQDPTFLPVEMYVCDYQKGKGDKDLQRVIDKWNKWSDENDRTPYSAWILNPFFTGPANDFDVLWLGAWADGNGMGASLSKWLADGGTLQGDFDKVIDCGIHNLSASVMLRKPGFDWPSESGMAAFTDCRIAEGKTIEDAMAAHRAWAEHLDKTGSKAGLWVFWPAFGAKETWDDREDAGKLGYDYKIVGSHPDMKSVGADFESYTNGGGWRTAMKLTNDVVSCDSPRIYNSRTVRNGNIDPGG